MSDKTKRQVPDKDPGGASEARLNTAPQEGHEAAHESDPTARLNTAPQEGHEAAHGSGPKAVCQTGSTDIPTRVLGFEPGDSFLHTLNPLCKMLLLVLTTVLAFSGSRISRQAVLAGFLALAALSGGTGFDRLRRRIRTIIIFSVTIVLVQMFFYKQGTPLTLAYLGRIRVVIWSQGLVRGVGLALRFLNVILASQLFIVTTDPNHLAYSLMQVGLPYRYGFMLVVALRFVPIFGHEMAQVRNAQLTKGIDVGSVGLKNLPRYLKYTVMPLVISALEKVDNLTISMEGRAFGLYHDRTYRVSFALTPKDWVATLFIAGVITVLWIIA